MPQKRTVYDKGTAEYLNEDGVKQKAVAAGTIEMWDVDAREAVARHPDRYSLRPWPKAAAPAPAPKPAAKAPAAKKKPAAAPAGVAGSGEAPAT